MRTIKFRAWDKVEKKMLSDFGLWDLHDDGQELEHGNGSMFVGRREYQLFHKGEFEFMQFTGLKDKNGKEIYEGDIVIIDEDDNENAVIEYIEEDAMFSIKLSNVIENFWNISGDSVEVIGNIYENPELLKTN